MRVLTFVMPGLVPGIHVLFLERCIKTWMAGSSPAMTRNVMTKTTPGNFFEDFRLGQTITHATPRTVTAGAGAPYNAPFGARLAARSSDPFASATGPPPPPPADLPVVPLVFGQPAPGIPPHAVADP